ncbi:MAG: penicillin-binding transpeptidase domain-containing protein, partial [Phycisphaerales bacterium]|nr:penicillin-binding transpeptidase domain-containing protein [Phycisphaerales bacterium]
MFQRRVLVLAACAVFVILILLAQLVRLAIVEGDQHHAVAQSRLHVQTWLPTWRGSIYDRKGRLLAEDRPAYDVAVSYDSMTGTWVEQRAARAARAAVGRERWNMLGPEEREVLIDQHRGPFAEVIDSMWAMLADANGSSVAEIELVGNQIKGKVQHMAAVVWDRQRQRHENRFSDAADRPNFRQRPIAEQEAFHVVLPNINDSQAVTVQRFSDAHPELVQVRYARVRIRPQQSQAVSVDSMTLPRGMQEEAERSAHLDQVGLQVLGDVRQGVWEEDMSRRPFRDVDTGAVDTGGYLLDDEVGDSGLERAWEDWLRGSRGSIARRRDRDEETRVDPVPGKDLQTTLDIALQAQAEFILSDASGLLTVQSWHGDTGLEMGRSLNAAAVILDIKTGEVLAMASAPNVSLMNQMTPVDRETRSPWVQRPVEAVYPPGSIVKPMVLAAAVMEGEHELDSSITCTGHHYPGRRDIARCWIYRPRYDLATHGDLHAEEALARSCNCFFYELGSRLGADRVSDWLEYFGAGRRLDTGLSAHGHAAVESAGSLPNAQEIEQLHRAGEADFEAIMLAIGQGRFAWTPLHAANAFAILARGGQRLTPTLVRGVRGEQESEDRIIDQHVVDVILEGLESAVTANHGTGSRVRYGPGDYDRIFNVEPTRIWGKTGTAQAPPMPSDLDGDGVLGENERVEGLHHAWFVGMAGEEEPEYALAVLVEHGGSGGRVAGPIANQLIRALMSEGYLPEA